MNSLLLIFTRLRYFAPAWVFASLNIMVGTWVLYIPYVKNKLEIDDAQLGIALFCFALGTLTMIPMTSKISNAIGIGKATMVGILSLSVFFLFPIIASSYLILCVMLFLTGTVVCLTDVSMNALVSEIEQEDEVHFMSASHGFFSLGGVIGAGIGSLIITFFEIPLMHMISASIFVIISNLLLVKSYLKIDGKQGEREKKSFQISLLKPLLGLTVISFLIMGSEGAIEHWSKLYLKEVVIVTSEKLSGFGFVTFSAMMTLGRFFGDQISKKFGPLKIIIGGSLIGALGFLAILMSEFYITVFGFGMVGLGYSVIVPELFRLAGKAKGVSTAEGISFVAGFGYVGFLLSPAFMGFLSKIGTLKLSFTALLTAAGIVILTALYLQKRK